MAHILVTGGLGFIGSHLCERLLRQGDTVFCLDNMTGWRSEDHVDLLFRTAGFQWRTADVVTLPCLPGPTPDLVIHLAAKAGVRASLGEPRGYMRTNVEGTANILERCKEAGVSKLLFASSSSVYGHPARHGSPSREMDICEPLSPYGVTKLCGEHQCLAVSHAYGMDIIALRFFSVYGPRQRPDLVLPLFARQMLAGQPLQVFGDGTSRRDYTYIDDIVEGICLAVGRLLGRPPRASYECYNLGSGAPILLTTLIDTLQEVLGVVDVLREHLPAHPVDASWTWADISRARGVLGYQPTVLLTDGVQRYVDWLRAS